MASIHPYSLKSKRSGRSEQRSRTVYRDPTGRQVVRVFETRRDAEAWLDLKAHERVTGTLADSRAGRQTLQELYEEVHAIRRYAPSTTSMHATAWKHVPDAVRRTPISAVDAAVVERVLSAVEPRR